VSYNHLVNHIITASLFEEIGKFVTHRSSDFGMENQLILGDGVVTGDGLVTGPGVTACAATLTLTLPLGRLLLVGS
jgi:propionyl-CoA carboxylase beta chain